MRRTRFGLLVLAVAWACFPVALVTGSLAPALLGAFLVALAVTARAPSAEIAVSRAVPARVTAGDEFEVVTRAEDAGGAPLFLEETIPPGVEVVSSRLTAERGRATLVTRARARDPGVVLWTAARARYQDAWGFLEDDVLVAARDAMQVLPERDALLKGARAGRRDSMGARSKGRKGLDSEPEIERLRDYQVGDRFRDIDWAHSTKLDRLIAREMRRDALLPVVVLLSAEPSMRLLRRASKFGTCARAALAVVAAAQASNLRAGLVAWSENGLEAQVRVTSARRAAVEAVGRLGGLPPPLPTSRFAPPRAAAVERPLAAGERAFLATSRAFAAKSLGSAVPVESALAALAKVSPQPSLVVAFVDAEEHPAIVSTLARRMRAHGHRLLVVAPASGPHHYALEDADDRVVDELVQWRRNRDEASAAAARHGVPFVPLGPDLSEAAIGEVIRSAV